MVEEEKNGSPEAETAESLSEGSPEEQQPAAEEAAEIQEMPEAALAQKRGRMIAGGLITAVIVSLIAVLVAGIFQFSSKWLRACPTELPVNDPSPKLWQELVSQQVSIHSLGVAETVKTAVEFKKSSPVPKESDTGTEATQTK